MASEILKSQINEGRRKELYYFRDYQGLEVDFLFPDRAGALWMAECKASKTVHPAMAKPMISLRDAMSGPVPPRLTVVHRKSSAPPTRALFPGVEALDVESFSEALAAPPKRGGRTPKPRLVRTAGR